MDHIHINKLKVDCLIGIYADELRHEQPVNVDIRLGMDLSQAGRTGKIGLTCDYSQVAAGVSALLKFRRYRLLEAAAEEIAAMIFGIQRSVDSLELQIEKPRALLRKGAESAGVEISRSREDFPASIEKANFGEVETFLETGDAGLYLLHLDPAKKVTVCCDEVTRALEWLVTGKALRNHDVSKKWSPKAWQPDQQFLYENAGTRRAALFCCLIPPQKLTTDN